MKSTDPEIMDCNGTIEILHRGYPGDTRSRKDFRIAFAWKPGQNTSVHLFDVANRQWIEACSYDCQTMGSKNDWNMRAGFSAARNATTAMGSRISTMDYAYRNGHLSTREDTQLMTQMGPQIEVTEADATCKPFNGEA